MKSDSTRRHILFYLAWSSALLALEGRAQAQSSELDQAVRELRAQQDELARRLDAVSGEIERLQSGSSDPVADQADQGLGRAASKVYRREQGLSIGGYGESVFQGRAGATDRFDALRVVTYVGYKFDEHFLFNSEIEIEHGTTEAESATTDEGGEVAVEFAYLDWLPRPDFGVRAGLLLLPVGLVNEMHEPTAFLPADRPQTERRILPSTWRESGVGLHGDVGGFAWRAYLVNGLNGEEFGASGLRDGRQGGNRAAAEDLAAVLRLDWVDTPGLLVGASLYRGDAGQDDEDLPDLGTTIFDVHADWRSGPWSVRAVVARAQVDDAGAFDAATDAGLAEELEGAYVEVGYDIFRRLIPVLGQSLEPFLRLETIDTQAELPDGVARDSSQDDEIRTFGVAWKPIESIVVKLDYQDWDEGRDQLDLLFGYVF